MNANQTKQAVTRVAWFEHRRQRPLSPPAFRLRLIRYGAMVCLLIVMALGMGMLGYRAFESMSWTDAFLNAAMILGGMGPVDPLKTEAGKLFAGGYALFSGLLFLVIAGLMFGPLLHRLLHHFHFDPESDTGAGKDP